jgi:hypothetical protein
MGWLLGAAATLLVRSIASHRSLEGRVGELEGRLRVSARKQSGGAGRRCCSSTTARPGSRAAQSSRPSSWKTCSFRPRRLDPMRSTRRFARTASNLAAGRRETDRRASLRRLRVATGDPVLVGAAHRRAFETGARAACGTRRPAGHASADLARGRAPDDRATDGAAGGHDATIGAARSGARRRRGTSKRRRRCRQLDESKDASANERERRHRFSPRDGPVHASTSFWSTADRRASGCIGL